MTPRRLFLSFSGGETSAFMCYAILNGEYRNRYDEIKVVFANTGQENEQTLQFVQQCDEAFGLGVVWVEAVVIDARVAPQSRIVNFQTASRDGRPFEDAIRKYGIPNQKFKDCTRNLKLNPLTHYLASIGWAKGTYDTAIGIRMDEIDRMSERAAERRIVYPLVQWLPTTKPEINDWWRRQPFRLQLKGYQGNCKWCWKKTMRKHMTLMKESPEVFDFPERMEREYGRIGPEFRKDTSADPLPADYKRTFFRANKSVQDIRDALAANPDFEPAVDDANIYVPFDPQLDVGAGCEESCEVFADEDEPTVMIPPLPVFLPELPQ